MANEQNLKPIRSKSEAREKGRKGGLAAGKKRRQLKTFKELFNAVLAEKCTDTSGQDWDSRAEYLAARVYRSAAAGNIRAFEVIRDTIGQKPIDKVEQTIKEPVSFSFEIVKNGKN